MITQNSSSSCCYGGRGSRHTTRQITPVERKHRQPMPISLSTMKHQCHICLHLRRQPKRELHKNREANRHGHDSIARRYGVCAVVAWYVVCLAPVFVPTATAMRIPRPWGENLACELAREPSWPFAYNKYQEQKVESNGRTNTNLQDDRHRCDRRGVRSKCHLCEGIACGMDLNSTCGYQLQGVNASLLSTNIPTVSDTPWAIGGGHRNDFGNSSVSRVCMMLSGGGCLEPFGDDYSNCTARCWGHGLSGAVAAVVKVVEPQGPTADGSTRYRATTAWEYPKARTSAYGPLELEPAFNPQGYVFTLAGRSGVAGYSDGSGAFALFRDPQDVAVDADANVYVADTGNHRIRLITPEGNVTTVAGDGEEGYDDGIATEASFSYPAGIAIDYDESEGLVLFVSDTNNHRVRKISGDVAGGIGVVSCYAGRCGNGTESWTRSKELSTPEAGFADGDGSLARFDGPSGLVVGADGTLFVADTNNHLIRLIYSNSTVFTLAGGLDGAELDSGGQVSCPPPCLKGVAGHVDGNLTEARFNYPADVSLGPNGTLLVADINSLRRIAMPEDPTAILGVGFDGKVSTVAGRAGAGEADGIGPEARFARPSGVTSTSDGAAYITEAASCRVRRVAPTVTFASAPATCNTTLTEVLRPSGCSSYDPPTGGDGLKVSQLSGNIWYNSWRNLTSFFNGSVANSGEEMAAAAAYAADAAGGYGEDSISIAGRVIRQCLGFPPPDRLDRTSDPYEALTVDDGLRSVPEDTGVGTTIRISCPTSCLDIVADGIVGTKGGAVHGSPDFYADTSAVCMAAVHAGILTAETEASSLSEGHDTSETVVVVVARLLPGNATAAMRAGSTANNVSASDAAEGWGRGFALETAHPAEVTAQTVTGKPAGALGEGCGDSVDGQPPLEAVFGRPAGIDAWRWGNLTNENFMYVADAGNHVIRAISAVCSFVCENNGTCAGPDTCQCPSGWTGHDCSLPSCAEGLCGAREVCIGPEECGCIPGYSGAPACQDPLCVQECQNGGSCAAPDACGCSDGWFGPNCTVPVCPQTCGNGGNCTAPGVCSCALEWSGGDGAVASAGAAEGADDCRLPVCGFTCLNGGWCVAPDTCACPPQWTGYDCAMPVCTQGYFLPGYNISDFDPAGRPLWSERYVPCDVEGWCNSTNGFDCSQPRRSSEAIALDWGPSMWAATGRSEEPDRCMMLELRNDVISPFSYLKADNETTPFARYSPSHPYEWISYPRQPWSAYNDTVSGRTGPFVWEQDRQVALAEYHNVTEGRYACANDGNCTSPGVCECAAGWAGFDCRTPICSQGYYESDQTHSVSGFGRSDDTDVFEPFMGGNVSTGYRLNWPYSNPNYTLESERFDNATSLVTFNLTQGNTRYLGPSTWSTDGSQRTLTYQGGYYCSIRANTEFENEGYVMERPNHWSRYMDTKVEDDNVTDTFWENMQWPPVHSKSARLELVVSDGSFYVYSDVGYMRDGDWTVMGAPWQKGVCLVQFNRTCPADSSKAIDLQSVALFGESVSSGVLVQDTDLSYRPRITYDIWREDASGRWQEEGGECVDRVLRGCYNNGTCVAPDICECSEGWVGSDCSIPICSTPCEHNGNCTLPDTCTCARGWTGEYCTEAVCAQDCNNGGTCVAPDVCKCPRWDTMFVDGREAGGRPLFRKPNGDSQQTGWTGYDCSVPICVQAEKFVLNVEDDTADDYTALGGHGFDGTLACGLVRCPKYDETYVTNLGTSFQTGCGHDPLDTGCCYWDSSSASWTCEYCEDPVISNHTFTCGGDISREVYTDIDDIPSRFLSLGPVVNLCGSDLTPLPPYVNADPTRSDWRYNSHSLDSNVTSGRFLCSRLQFEQGDFFDDAGLGSSSGFGTDSGLVSGRHVRSNYNNYTQVDENTWTEGVITAGEGIYMCHNGGSCLAPDTCSCADGWDGYDCETPLCRHLQPSGVVSSCQNGGICAAKDDCDCVTTDSVLWQVYENANRDITGWTGTDCSMPMCAQGFFDPFCTDLPQAPGGEGCFRCPNGGVCSAPDHCDCADGWAGYDCRTPVCEVVADSLMRVQLNTLDEDRVRAFEADPCAMEERYAAVAFEGADYFRGNCTAPNQCTCMCWAEFDVDDCSELQTNCDGPWQDPLVEYRDVLPVTYGFGTGRCWTGYEGIMSDEDRFMTCHYSIFQPSWVQRNSIPLIVGGAFLAFFGSIVYTIVRRRLKRRFLRAKIERRRSRRSSEMSQLSQQPHAFAHRG